MNHKFMSKACISGVPAGARLPVGMYVFQARLLQPWRTPAFEGSALRGVFGRALRALACSTGLSDCGACPLRESCSYTAIFERQVREHVGSEPGGYVLQVLRPTGQCTLAPGTPYLFGMTLFGRSRQLLPLIIRAWQQALETGVDRDNICMTLERVTLGHGPEIWHHARPEYALHSSLMTVPPAPDTDTVVLHLLTPWHMKYRGRMLNGDALSPAPLIMTLRQRMQAAVPGFPEPPAGLADRLRLEGMVQWMHWERASLRQNLRMNFSGLTGVIRLGGDWQALWPWLWTGQWLHLGKHTTFGLGRYVLQTC